MTTRYFLTRGLVLGALIAAGCGARSSRQGDADVEHDAGSPDSDVEVDREDGDPEQDGETEASEMVLIPAGPYLRTDSQYGLVWETYISAFWIDRFEVTNAEFRGCVEEGVCLPAAPDSATRPDYFTDPAYDRYPAVRVSWTQAELFCRWAGKRLPTEAEWEKAARGGCEILGADASCELDTDAPDYPWGATPGTECELANNTERCLGDTSEVGSYPAGASPYVVYDMIGNVTEWVSDWYVYRYPVLASNRDPQGPSEEEAAGRCHISEHEPCHVVKSSPYSSPGPEYRAIDGRAGAEASLHGLAGGFRCARDPEE